MNASLKGYRQRCERKLNELDLPIPFDVRMFCKLLSRRRGRRIELRAMHMGNSPSGAWVTSPHLDAIFYESATSALHQDQIILHEACHMVLGHQSLQLSEPDVAQLLFPGLEPGMMERMLPRAGYTTEEEREAEFLASLILDKIACPDQVRPPIQNPETAAVLGRLEASLRRGVDEQT